MQNKATVKLGNLHQGDAFEVPSLNGLFCEGVVVRVTACSVLAEYKILDVETRRWISHRNYLSSTVDVIVTGQVEIEDSGTGNIKVIGQAIRTEASEIKQKEPTEKENQKKINDLKKELEDLEKSLAKKAEKVSKVKAVKRSVSDTTIPCSSFTVKDFCSLNQLEYQEGYPIVKQLLSENKIKATGTKKPDCGKGKLATVYSKV